MRVPLVHPWVGSWVHHRRVHRWVHPWVLGSWVLSMFTQRSKRHVIVEHEIFVIGTTTTAASNDNIGCELHRLFIYVLFAHVLSELLFARSCSLARVVFHVHVALRSSSTKSFSSEERFVPIVRACTILHSSAIMKLTCARKKYISYEELVTLVVQQASAPGIPLPYPYHTVTYWTGTLTRVSLLPVGVGWSRYCQLRFNQDRINSSSTTNEDPIGPIDWYNAAIHTITSGDRKSSRPIVDRHSQIDRICTYEGRECSDQVFHILQQVRIR